MPADPDAKTPIFQRPVGTPAKRSPKEIMEDAMADGLAVQGFRMGLGYDPAAVQPQQPVRATESISLNVGEIFKGLSDLNVGLAKELLAKKEQAQNPSDERLWTFMLAQLDRLQQRQDSAQSQQDPFAVVFDNLEKYKQVVTGLQQHEPANLQLSQAGMNIESLKIQSLMQDSKQQHEERMQTMTRQWDREDKRWLEEFKLKQQESNSNQRRAQEAGGFLEDLANALAGSLEPSQGSSIAAAPRPARLKTFKCQPPHGCGGIVQVASPDAIEATCGNCGLIWDLPGYSPPSPPPVQNSPVTAPVQTVIPPIQVTSDEEEE